ncbi:MAG: AAA family ATPase [Anaerolineales bacterium]|nr:AAA family ATPase [Anaerolineales bacterium]
MEKEIGEKTNRLHLAWLGTPLVSYAEQPVMFRTRKALALLIYLTTEVGPHSREKLTTLFWPESDTARGRGMLRTTLAHLREVMDTFDTLYLLVEPQTLGFDFQSNFELDLHTLQAALEITQRQPSPAERKEAISHLQVAASRYRGDFLEGFSLADTPTFDDWVSLQREVWHNRMNLIFDALSQLQFEHGDLPGGIETATRWKVHDPYGEAAPQRLMQLYFADGNRSAALQVYEAYSQMLAAEFGAKPAPEIEHLAARIRTRVQPRRLPEHGPPALVSLDISFVGRVEEFKRLMTTYHLASSGQTQVVILAGEAGIGKTRLATEFLHWATAQGADVLSGRAFETGGELPYQPLAQLLRQHLDQEKAPVDLLSETWLAELSRLLPELRDRYPDLPPLQQDEGTARGRLLEAITRLGRALADRAPLLLFIDDIQWADTASLDALHYAVSRWVEYKSPVLVLLCARDTLLVTKTDAQYWLTGLKAKVAVTQLALAPLTGEDTLALVASLEAGQTVISHTARVAAEDMSSETQPSPPKFSAFAQALFTETGGQPLYLVETIKALLEQKVLIPYHTTEGAQRLQWSTLAGEASGRFPLPRIIPTGIREAILDRLSRLTPAAAAMLTAAAVLGQAASFRQLAEMSGINEMTSLDALEELIAKRLLLDTNHADQPYLIAHDRIRDVVYAETSAPRKQVLHRRAVTTLQGTAPARLAYHALAAGMNEEAFHYSLAAGDMALHLFAASEAATHYENARKLVVAASPPPFEIAACQHLYTSLGRALELNAQFEQAWAVYEEMGAVARQLDAPAMKLAALMVQATLRSIPSQSFNPSEGQVLAEQALILARELGDSAAEVKILWNLLNLYRPSSKIAQAIACGEQALALARELNLREQMAFILNDLALPYWFSGHLDRARESLHEASVLWRELSNLPMLTDSLAGLAGLAVDTGDYDLALTYSEEAFQISQAIANLWGQSYSKLSVGYIYWDRGQPDQAITVMQECLRLGDLANYLTPQVGVRADMAAIYGGLGAIERGLETARQALTIAETQMPNFRPYVLSKLAQLYLQQDNLSEVEAVVEQGKIDPNRETLPYYFQPVILTEVELALKQGRYEHGLASVDDLLATLNQFGLRIFIPEALYLRGQTLVAMGQTEAARETLLEAQAEAEALGSRRMLWQILFALSQLERDLAKATQWRRQAQEIVAYIIANVSDPDLRTSFLRLPKVQEVLDSSS